MPLDSDTTPMANRPQVVADEMQAIRALAIQVAAQVTLAHAIEVVSSSLAAFLNSPIALLSRDPLSWRFETHAFPDPAKTGALARLRRSETTADPLEQLQEDSGHAWTAIALGTLGDRDWALLVPGQSGAWRERPGFEQLVENVSGSLGQVANRELADYANRFQRGLHAFNRRLARESNQDKLNALVLKTLARQVRAETGALALYVPAEDALAIVATVGYPLSVVEHLRIRPGDGLIGGAYRSGKPLISDSSRAGSARLRYRTDSYMVLPIIAGAERLGVIALTDRSDGRRFDARDFASARLMVSSAASAFSRQRLHERLAQLTEVATIDPVTGLFNRRYLETRLEAEVERARRQRQDLTLLLIDIDDFKRVNDTRGHLEGDRVLREVADLLRAGVRIFDVCARYGGEEFIIVMPAASTSVAQQVAERIRARIERYFAQDTPSVTVSVGIGGFTTSTNAEELIDLADRALISAKRAGKNMVSLDIHHSLRDTN
jgi:diguanylate cyclase (GGDEF)-like protein